MVDSGIIRKDEKTVFALRSLYEKYGYVQFKMNKFEEYDLYLRNKDFLVSDNIISFTDVDGKLMALKPDVTLSIVKDFNDGANALKKVYYNENVYRVSKVTKTFKEIMQVGLECIGDIDGYCVSEALLLALKSLESISEDFVLDVSNVGIVSEIMDSLDLSDVERETILRCFSEKNSHDIAKIKGAEKLSKLVLAYGDPDTVRKVLDEFYPDGLSESAVFLVNTIKDLEDQGYRGRVKIDFSVLNDMNYYNGIVFNGFVNGIATSILSGGQYDKLMNKIGKGSKAIGFAVYLDLLEQFEVPTGEFDVDTLVLYSDKTEINLVSKAVRELTDQGRSVLARRNVPEKIRYKHIVIIDENGVVSCKATC